MSDAPMSSDMLAAARSCNRADAWRWIPALLTEIRRLGDESELAFTDGVESVHAELARKDKALADKQAAVLALHAEDPQTGCCATCGHAWPCATEFMFETDYEALGGEDE